MRPTWRSLPALRWPDEYVRQHAHHHHRFEAQPQGPALKLKPRVDVLITARFALRTTFATSIAVGLYRLSWMKWTG